MVKVKILVILLVLSAISLECGITFLKYIMFNPVINLILTVLGVLGMYVTAIKLYDIETNIKKNEALNELEWT